MSKQTDDRDRSIDRLLPRALEVRGTSAPTNACLDAETLAAWADEALSRAEREAAEAHVADCTRCQALLASMVAITPAPIRSSSRWRLPSAGWLIPLTAAAAAAVVWVAVPRHPTLQQRTQRPVEVAKVDHPTPATSADATPALAAPRLELQQSTATKDTSAGRGDTSRGATPAAPVASNAPRATVAPLVSAESIGRRESADAFAAPAPAPSITPRAMPAPMQSDARAFGAAAMPVIASSGSAVRWRLVPGGNVERTSDGGATWQMQETGATETLAAGASPSPLVCWLVGPHGSILLSTDGRSWRRIEFPGNVALVAVSADDERTATVTTIDGRRFSTSDAGRTWTS